MADPYTAVRDEPDHILLRMPGTDYGLTLADARAIVDALTEALRPGVTRAQAIADALGDLGDDRVIVHRDVPGEHVNVVDCWCSPLAFQGPGWTAEKIEEAMRKAEEEA